MQIYEFFLILSHRWKSMQKIFADFFSVTFLMIEKSPKDLADGKCSRTGPYAPTVGRAYARSDRGKCRPDSLQVLVELVMKRKIPLLLDSTNERVQSQACLSYAERGGERGRSPPTGGRRPG